MKIRTGDTVVIISGKDKGKQGTVMRVLESKNRVVVEGINMRVRHVKKTPNQAGSRVSFEASIHASNVMMLDPKTKKPTRVGYKVDEKTGKKTRFAKGSGETIAKAVKSDKKKPAAGARPEPAERVPARGEQSKAPFWKRGGGKSGSDDGVAGTSGDTGPNTIQTAHRAQGG